MPPGAYCRKLRKIALHLLAPARPRPTHKPCLRQAIGRDAGTAADEAAGRYTGAERAIKSWNHGQPGALEARG